MAKTIHQLVLGIWCLVIYGSNPIRCVRSSPVSACTTLYGIRMGTTEIDGVRCQMVNATIVGSFLVTLKARVGNRSLDLEITNCSVPVLDRTLLALTRIRRLRINWSGLRNVTLDGFDGLEDTLEELDLSHNQLEEIPVAIGNLTLLSHLDLSRNQIRSLPQGTVFFRLLKLRHFNLNHNRLGFLDTVRYERNERNGGHGTNDTKLLPMAIFNLEPLREHLEILQLRSNNLTSFPQQFSRPFKRLRYLDLSANQFAELPADAFAKMPQLQELYLDNNDLARVPKLELSSSLEILSLRDNPLACDCHAAWLWQLLESAGTGTNPLELHLGDCRTPTRYQGIHLRQLASDFCDKSTEMVAQQTEESIGPLEISLVPKTDSVQVQIQLPQSYDISDRNTTFSWEIRQRQFGKNQQISTNGSATVGGVLKSRNWTMNVTDLKPSTGYRICVEIESSSPAHQVHCQEIMTLEEEEVFPAATEIAVAASVSTSTTLAVVAVVCCCCPSVKCGKKKGAKSKKEQENSDIQVSSDDDHLPPKINNNNNNNNNGSIPENWQRRASHFATVPVHHRPVNDDESKRMFQATCEYLRRRNFELSLGPATGPKPTARNSDPLSNGTSDYVSAEMDSGEHSVPSRTRNHHFNSSYGIDCVERIRFNTIQTSQYLANAAVHPVPVAQYYAWRRRPLTWTTATYNQFLANGPPVPFQPSNTIAHAIPVYSMATLPRRHFSPKSSRKGNQKLHWSAAPPLQTADMQF